MPIQPDAFESFLAAIVVEDPPGMSGLDFAAHLCGRLGAFLEDQDATDDEFQAYLAVFLHGILRDPQIAAHRYEITRRCSEALRPYGWHIEQVH